MPQRIKRLIGCVLMAIFACYYANVTLFFHGHVINGVTIVHSHFHGKAHAQTGTHTPSELTLIAALSVIQSCPPVPFFAGLALIAALCCVFLAVPERKIASRPIRSYCLRGPPVLA